MKLAIVATHPIQYYAPWFKHIYAQPGMDGKVFYLWDFGITEKLDPEFGRAFTWDIPLLEGYPYEFVENVSKAPGTHHYSGLHNPDLCSRLEEYNPDCILLMAYKYKSYIDLITYWKLRKKCPMLFRGDSHRLKPRRGIAALIEKTVLGVFFRYFLDGFLYVGSANKTYFEEHRAPSKRLFFTPHAIDNERFIQIQDQRAVEKWRTDLGIPSDDTLILFLGKFEERKHPCDLVQAFCNLRPEKCSLVFVGDGALSQSLESAARKNEKIFVSPFQNQSEIPKTLAACDLLVLPSDERETWGLVVNEAMCQRKPALVSNLVGCGPDLVVPERTGLIFECGNPDSLRQKLEIALADRKQLAKWGENAFERVQQYSYENATKGLLEALHAVLPEINQQV